MEPYWSLIWTLETSIWPTWDPGDLYMALPGTSLVGGALVPARALPEVSLLLAVRVKRVSTGTLVCLRRST